MRVAGGEGRDQEAGVGLPLLCLPEKLVGSKANQGPGGEAAGRV